MPNILSLDKQATVTALLKEGYSTRQVRAATGVSLNAVMRYAQMLKSEIICEHGIRKYMCRPCQSGRAQVTRAKVLPEGLAGVCPKCGGKKLYVVKGRDQRNCANPFCKHRFSSMSLTIFKDHKLPAETYLKAADLGHLSINQMAKQLGVTWKTAQSIRQKLRSAA